MKNFVSVGNTLTITAGADIASGAGVLVGSLFGVAAGPIANGAEGVINLTGVYDLPKAGSQAWTVGALIYWDAGNARCTATASTHKLIGVAVAAVGSGAGETIGRVRLNGAGVN
jgi:predicted RecA/RadA family phage recombinase